MGAIDGPRFISSLDGLVMALSSDPDQSGKGGKSGPCCSLYLVLSLYISKQSFLTSSRASGTSRLGPQISARL